MNFLDHFFLYFCSSYFLQLDENGKKIYTNCSCAMSRNSEMMPNLLISNSSILMEDPLHTKIGGEYSGWAMSGSCPVDCQEKFYIFLAVVCLLKFSGSTGRASNFLVSVRCVEEKDKTVSMGFGLMIMSLFAFIPSPIFFGYILGKFSFSLLFFYQLFIIMFLINFMMFLINLLMTKTKIIFKNKCFNS